MWKRAEILEGHRYYLALIQSSTGARSYELCEVGYLPKSSEVALTTQEVPRDLLLRRDVCGISEVVLLTDGRRYGTEAHGIWFTPEETMAWDRDEEVPWLNGLPPSLPPK